MEPVGRSTIIRQAVDIAESRTHVCILLYVTRHVLHGVTIRDLAAIFTLHGETTMKSSHREWREQMGLRMNKEYRPDWDQPIDSSTDSAASSKPQVASNGVKQIVTIRLDVDMLEWFKTAGPGYQTRINQVLREHMDAQRNSQAE